VDRYSRSGNARDESWRKFADHVTTHSLDAEKTDSYVQLCDRLEGIDTKWGGRSEHVYYLAVPPTLIEVIGRNLSGAGLLDDCATTRIVVEKPFGRDLNSARHLNRVLASVMNETQIYRIDHYLGKETVQNILAFRFANSMFEPIWNRRYIDHVQITVAEQIGVENRGGYYEQAGALRDMIQNHLLQILCHVALEPPVTYATDEILNKKVDVLRAIRPIARDEINRFAVRGQYGPGKIEGRAVLGYRNEPSVAGDSPIETYVALQLFIDNWRWQGVPFYLRTGKRLSSRISEVCVYFRPVPHRSFPMSAGSRLEPNLLTIRILPDEGILLEFQAKHPGHLLRLEPVLMRFSYQESFQAPLRDAYETLLRDVMLGDETLFMRADQVEAAWAIVAPVLSEWEATIPTNFPNYAVGSHGPAAADEMLARDGRSWHCAEESGHGVARASEGES